MSELLTPTPEILVPEVNPTPEAVITQPQAEKVDINSILSQAEAKATEVAEKKADAVMRSMLKENGFDDDTIKTMIAEHKAKQVTPEMILKEKDDAIKELKNSNKEKDMKLIAISKGIPVGSTDETIAEKVSACLTLAKNYTSSEVPFDVALDKAMKHISFESEKIIPPPMYGGSGKSTVTVDTEKQKKIDAARAAMKIK